MILKMDNNYNSTALTIDDNVITIVVVMMITRSAKTRQQMEFEGDYYHYIFFFLQSLLSFPSSFLSKNRFYPSLSPFHPRSSSSLSRDINSRCIAWISPHPFLLLLPHNTAPSPSLPLFPSPFFPLPPPPLPLRPPRITAGKPLEGGATTRDPLHTDPTIA